MADHHYQPPDDASPADSTYDANLSSTLTPSAHSAGGPFSSAIQQHATAGRKRKANGSSRGVANLTPDQLAKKRANDREAQRAIRKRTKAQIEALEEQVRELTSQQPYQDLQTALREKQAFQAENDEIRRRLASVLAIVQPIVDASSLLRGDSRNSFSGLLNGSASNNPSWSGQSQADLPSPASHPEAHTRPPPPPSQPNAVSESNLRTSLSLEHTPATTSYPGSPGSVDTSSPATAATSTSYALRQNWQGHSAIPQSEGQSYAAANPWDHQTRILSHGLDFTGTGERLGLNFLLDSSQRVPKVNDFRQSPNSPPVPMPVQYRQPSSAHSFSLNPNTPPYSFPTLNLPATCPLDGILLEFLRARRRDAENGISTGQVLGPAYPSVKSLLNPDSTEYSHPLSKVFTDILSKFPDISALPEQIAVLYVMFLFMRWQIYPTQENYDRLPEWFAPRPSQLVKPHPAWIDYVPWPRMRDRMIDRYTDYPFECWFIPYTSTLSINWPYEATDALITVPDSKEVTINPVFERHLRNLHNWSLGSAFAITYPALADTMRIKDPGDEREQKPTSSMTCSGYISRKPSRGPPI
ncbi:hypothetical protein AJ80_04737 [Polytolypa hystricis UAMH7299]|uniref:BZIP domain-containing protein n=1 Tax=Polytolypa hystricis (strain UAMH7299) TaxID=1447883 RepID=A0A2B7Y8Z0_POLH7|nr:hypothetical protein AJ80_04737 [Polytolypa hystricis UAMH7299]